ncbi:MAG: hypothetical protein DRJ97_01620 [Thermoprotei archaeon]|nr:MAG: hypothetical protein DRJ97_01620 [Thermoprotei archaeon]
MRTLDRYLLMKPGLRATIEWLLLIVVGLPCYLTKTLTLPFTSIFTALGVTLFIVGMFIHGLSHKEHRQAHAKVEEVEKLVTTGIYSKVRHPGYLGIMLVYFGASLCLGNVPALIVASMLAALHVLTAVKEEELLLKKFGREYEEYRRRVKWRFIPGVY